MKVNKECRITYLSKNSKHYNKIYGHITKSFESYFYNFLRNVKYNVNKYNANCIERF